MTGDERAVYDLALRPARLSAYPVGEFVGQESFMRASEILSLAVKAGVSPGISVLDLCCGVAGPGRFITSELGCEYLGVDASSSAIDMARERTTDLACRFEVAQVPPIPIPSGPFDVVLLLETVLAFPDKEALLREITASLKVGGRFAFTLEEGRPLTRAERQRMPDADTVWLMPLQEMLSSLERVGLRVLWQDECSEPHRVIVDALIDAFAAGADAIAARLGRHAVDDLLSSHRTWSDWLREGRARKFAFVVEKSPGPTPTAGGGSREGRTHR
jgi:SAM-dependent methyltransferase